MDKLTILQRALVETGNNPINTLYDGSDEWRVADIGFDRGIRLLLSQHQWPFATETVPIQRAGDSPDPGYEDAYALPTGTLHFRRLITEEGYPVGSYAFKDGQILTTFNGLSGTTTLLADIVREPDGDAQWHPMAEEVLTLTTEASILRGLNEDFSEANNRDKRADSMLLRAQTRSDQQTPPRRGFYPRMSIIRGTRRF